VSGVLPVLAHAGPGATWQSLLVVAALGLTVVALLAVAGRVQLAGADDLVLPLAGVAIASSLAPLGSEWLSDWIGWALPLGVVMLATIVVAALTSLELSLRSPLTYGAVAVAVVAAVGLYAPLTRALHPPADFLPIADDVEVAISDPTDGGEVDAGTVQVTVSVSGGSVQGELLSLEQLPEDPEEAGALVVAVDGELVPTRFTEDCTVDSPCTEVSFPVTLAPGDRRIAVEFRRGDGVPLTPLVTDAVTVTAD
jgi:hypothetical protein